MPQLSDLVEKRKFVKKSYRPWDLSGAGEATHPVEPHEAAQPKASTPVTVNTPLPPVEQSKSLSQQEVVKEIPAVVSPVITDNISGNKTDNIEVTTRKQSGNKRVTPSKQPANIEMTTRQQLDNDTDNVTGNSTDIHYLTESIKKLSGLQKNIFLYVINVCTARGVLDTGNILSSDLSATSNCSIGSAKTSLNRLLEKHLIIRHQGKACRGGHMVLGITKEIQAAAIQAQLALFNPLKASNPDNVSGNIMGNNGSYSSSIYNNKTTTTALPDEWKSITYDSLADIGFSETQLRQLYQSNTTTPEIVQESIHHFAFGLAHNIKLKSYADPLNVLMGVLRKGGIWAEKNYISPREQALALLFEQKKIEAERIQSLENKILDEEYKIWISNLSSEDKDRITSTVPQSSYLSKALADKANEGYLLQHFKNHVYGKTNFNPG